MIPLLVSACAVVLLDQLSRVWIAHSLAVGERLSLAPSFYLRHEISPRLAGALRSPASLLAQLALLLACSLLLLYATHSATLATGMSLGAALGGATSNLYSRARLGAVHDILQVFNLPVFNLADIAITCGSLALLVLTLR